MKKLFFLFVCAAIAAACSSEMEVPSPINPEDEMVEVSFNLAGDYVSVEETPMTRAFAEGAETLYGIQIWNYEDRDHGDFVETLKFQHAWGLFNDLRNARISLNKNERYNIQVLVIEEREDTIFQRDGHYGAPFGDALYDSQYKSEPTLTNEFIIDSNSCIGTEQGSYTAGPMFYSVSAMMRMDRYFGAKDFQVSDGGIISVDMDRYAFSFTYNVVPPLDGVIRVKLPNFDNRVIYEVKAGESQKKEQVIHNAPFNAEDKDASKDIKVVIEWERGTPELKNYTDERTITVKRKMNYNMNINMNARDNETNFEFNMDKENFSEETFDIN